MKKLKINKVFFPAAVSISQPVKANSNNVFTKTNKQMKTIEIKTGTVPVLFDKVGKEKFSFFLQRFCLKRNGKHYLACDDYAHSLDVATKLVGLDPDKFSNIKNIMELELFRAKVKDLLNVRQLEKDAHKILGVVNFYVKFVQWVNDNTPHDQLTYAIAA